MNLRQSTLTAGSRQGKDVVHENRSQNMENSVRISACLLCVARQAFMQRWQDSMVYGCMPWLIIRT